MDRAALDRAYANGAAVPETAALLEGWRARSAAFRMSHPPVTARFAAGERCMLDLFGCGIPGAPTLLYVHGGYWQYRQHGRETSSALAAGLLARGVNVAVTGYGLAPEVTLDGMIAELRAALDVLTSLRLRVAADPSRLCVMGWSAGAHLAVSVMDHPAVTAAVAISGIFDLEPIRLGSLNGALRLDAEAACRLSPLRQLPARSPPLHLAVGGVELPELRRQSAEYAVARRAAGLPVTHAELPGHNHFTLLDEVASPDGAIASVAIDLLSA